MTSLTSYLRTHAEKQIETIKRFLTTPMGIYEFADELIKNRRALIMGVLRGARATTYASPFTTRILRE